MGAGRCVRLPFALLTPAAAPCVLALFSVELPGGVGGAARAMEATPPLPPTPSRRDGVTEDRERGLIRTTINTIIDAGQRLKM